MEGVSGWRSDLYAYVPDRVKTFLGPVEVFNGSNNQTVTSNQRLFPDGTFFVDCLSNANGKVFELRVREKDAGQWHSYVAFKDRDSRPDGYAGLPSSKSCAECHSQTGTGGYNAGLVPGGDTIISFPMQFEKLQEGVWYN
jgi:hypothetical protein